MTARRVLWALVVVAILLCYATFALAQNSQARIVRLSYIDGDARIDQGSGQGEQQAIQNMPVISGTRLMAQDGSRVEVEFENGSTLRLVGPAEVNFRELSLKSSGNKMTAVEVMTGLAYFDITRKGDDDFRISFKGHNLSVRKSGHFRVDAGADSPKLAVFKGELEMLDAPDVAVKKGETITFDSSDPAHYALAKNVDPLGADVWDHDRAQDRDTYAKSQVYKNSLTYAGSPYSYGMYDLASYGSWYSGAGGSCWRPAGYGFGWNPFDQGAWTYYPGNGWVFVSGYPWGWTPFRYGAWNWFGGTGWCWSPGGYGGWNAYPVVVTRPPAFQPIRPPTRPPGPPVFVGGRKVPDGGRPDPDAFRHPARGFGDDAPPVHGKRLPPVVGEPDLPTDRVPAGVKVPTPVPSGKRWDNGEAAGRGNHGRDTPAPTQSPKTSEPAPTPGQTPKSDVPRPQPPAPRADAPRAPAPHVDSSPRVAPAPAPRMDTSPRTAPTPAPAPRMDSSPRMAPAPSPPKTSPH